MYNILLFREKSIAIKVKAARVSKFAPNESRVARMAAVATKKPFSGNKRRAILSNNSKEKEQLIKPTLSYVVMCPDPLSDLTLRGRVALLVYLDTAALLRQLY